MSNQAQLLHDLYGFVFPDDFFAFQDFAFSVGTEILWQELGVQLGLPFLIGTADEASYQSELQWKERYYDDPPEFFTILSGDTDGSHWGYYIDDPSNHRFSVSQFFSKDVYEFSVPLFIYGDTLIEMARQRIEEVYFSHDENIEYDPDEADAYRESQAILDGVLETLKSYGTKDREEASSAYLDIYSGVSWRDGHVVAPTRDKMGIVVPKDAWRPLMEKAEYDALWKAWPPDPAQLERLVQDALSLGQNGYPGAALQFGKDLWVDQEHRESCYHLLDTAYSFLGREFLRGTLKAAQQHRAFCDANWPPGRHKQV